MSEPTEMHMSEYRRLKPRPCQTCGGTEEPRHADPVGSPDPKVIVAYYCTNRHCDNSSGW